MRRSKVTIVTLLTILTLSLVACAHLTGKQQEALSEILGRRIGQHGTQLDYDLFIHLGTIATEACAQAKEGATPPDIAFSMIAKAIEKKTGDPSLAHDLRSAIKFMGIGLDQAFNVINLTAEKSATIQTFICSFAQGVNRAKRNL